MITNKERLREVIKNIPDYLLPTLNMAALMEEIEQDPSKIKPVENPRIYHMETTLKCNLECPFCPRTTDLLVNHQRDLNEDMTIDNFKRVLDKMPWVKSIELFHYGEPFMQKNFHEFVQICTDRGIFSVAASNLLPATEEKVEQVFGAGLGFLVMDIDSLDAEQYAKLRVNGSLDVLQKRVQHVLSRSVRPYCVAQLIMMPGAEPPENFEPHFIKWANGQKPDAFHYKFYDALRGEIIPEKGTLKGVCREPFYGFAVHLNGDVLPCNRDWAGEHVMGNLFETEVHEIWMGEKYQEFRKRMLSEDKPDFCKHCPEGDYFNARSQQHIQVNMLTGLDV